MKSIYKSAPYVWSYWRRAFSVPAKDDESGSSSPLLRMSVQLGCGGQYRFDTDQIDHANRLVTVSLSQEARDLSHVLCNATWSTVRLFIRRGVTNPVRVDLTT